MPDDNGNGNARRPRPFWSGIIAFGLVSIPVTLYAANRASRVPKLAPGSSGSSVKYTRCTRPHWSSGS